jgi:hypothetical protein
MNKQLMQLFRNMDEDDKKRLCQRATLITIYAYDNDTRLNAELAKLYQDFMQLDNANNVIDALTRRIENV